MSVKRADGTRTSSRHKLVGDYVFASRKGMLLIQADDEEVLCLTDGEWEEYTVRKL